MNLRNIKVGDNLSGKTIYCNFPDDFYTMGSSIPNHLTLNNAEGIIITDTKSENYFYKIYSTNNDNNITIVYKNSAYGGSWFYAYNLLQDRLINNYKTVIMPSAFGTVTHIDTSHPAYQYIKIEDPEPTGIGKILFNTNEFKKVIFNNQEYVKIMFNNEIIWSKGKEL